MVKGSSAPAGASAVSRVGGGTRRRVSILNGETLSATDTQRKVVEAAIECIVEQGLYRASSNVIAERAGITWGVIQYYFGTRENLMLAVLEEGNRRLLELLASTKIQAGSFEQRLNQLIGVLVEHYASPDYLAFVQVLINLSHDPKSSQRARDSLAAIESSAGPEIERLSREVFAGTGLRSPKLREAVFHLARGLAVSQVMLTVSGAPPPAKEQSKHMRELLAKGLACALQPDAKV